MVTRIKSLVKNKNSFTQLLNMVKNGLINFFIKRHALNWLLVINFGLLFCLLFIMTNFFPQQIKNLIFPNSYFIFLFLILMFLFNCWFFITKNIFFSFNISLLLIFLIYLKIQKFVFNCDLQLLILIIFVIITISSMGLKLFNKYACCAKKTHQKRRK